MVYLRPLIDALEVGIDLTRQRVLGASDTFGVLV